MLLFYLFIYFAWGDILPPRQGCLLGCTVSTQISPAVQGTPGVELRQWILLRSQMWNTGFWVISAVAPEFFESGHPSDIKGMSKWELLGYSTCTEKSVRKTVSVSKLKERQTDKQTGSHSPWTAEILLMVESTPRIQIQPLSPPNNENQICNYLYTCINLLHTLI